MHSEFLLIGLAGAVLLSYWYSHLARLYRLPSVMLLIATGVALRLVTHTMQSTVALPQHMLPVLGTVGLVLIVLEGALDLRLEPGRRAFLWRSFAVAALGVAATTGALAFALGGVFGLHGLTALLVAVPFGVISSAVAIPSAAGLPREDREFVVYESSWSDILGVMAFNGLVVAWSGGAVAANLLGGSLLVIAGGVAISLAVYGLVGHLEGHVKFVPLLCALIVVYAGADALHLSPLIIVLILGLVLNNSQLLRRFPLLARLHSNHYDTELARLKHLTAEATFVVRTFFFLLLGYVTDLGAFIQPLAWAMAVGIVGVILAVRWVVLAVGRVRGRHLLWLSPRGLVTATLFFNTPAGVLPAGFPTATLILVVLLSGLVMAVGLRRDGATAAAPGSPLVPDEADEAGAALPEPSGTVRD